MRPVCVVWGGGKEGERERDAQYSFKKHCACVREEGERARERETERQNSFKGMVYDIAMFTK